VPLTNIFIHGQDGLPFTAIALVGPGTAFIPQLTTIDRIRASQLLGVEECIVVESTHNDRELNMWQVKPPLQSHFIIESHPRRRP